MKNSYTLYKSIYSIYAILIISVLTLAINFYQESSMLLKVINFVFLATAIYATLLIEKIKSYTNIILTTLEKWNLGNTNDRIMFNCEEKGQHTKVFQGLNDLADTLEYISFEILLCTKATAEFNIYRLISENGLSGPMKKSIHDLNFAIKFTADKGLALAETSEKIQQGLKKIVDDVYISAKKMKDSCEKMFQISNISLEKSAIVEKSAFHAQSNVSTIAVATDELSSAISEINEKVHESNSVTLSANEEAKKATGMINNLNESSNEISEIIELISNIAEQTNLLALNATIEAARAGEAGKGFAVVANEVKNLANQTVQATERISKQVKNVQESITTTVGTIEKISDTISKTNEISTAVANAVTEQSAATQDISSNMKEATTSTKDVTSTIVSIKSASENTHNYSNEMLDTSQILDKHIETLAHNINTFADSIKTTQ